jgi:hypothetical protein
MRLAHQFSLAYLLGEVALVAIALAAGRLALFSSTLQLEVQAVCYCLAITAACGALGGLMFRMVVGLVAGGVFSVAAIPLVWLIISAVKS